jgi:hypothetical protein
MARKTKEPGKRLPPQVREWIDEQFGRGWTPPQVDRALEKLRRDNGKFRETFAGLDPGDVQCSLRVLYERRAWWKEKRTSSQEASAGVRWGTASTEQPVAWLSLDPDEARMVLAAVAAWESVTGMDWGTLTESVARHIAYLARAAPDLPPQAVAALASRVDAWTLLPQEEKNRRWEALGRFLGYRPWSSPEAEARYLQAVGSRDHFMLDSSGLPVYVVVARATLIGHSSLKATAGVESPPGASSGASRRSRQIPATRRGTGGKTAVHGVTPDG